MHRMLNIHAMHRMLNILGDRAAARRGTRKAGEGAVQPGSGAPWWALSASAVLG